MHLYLQHKNLLVANPGSSHIVRHTKPLHYCGIRFFLLRGIEK